MPDTGERVYLVRSAYLSKWLDGSGADEGVVKDRLVEINAAIPNTRKRRPGPVWQDWRKPVGRASFVVLRASVVEGEG